LTYHYSNNIQKKARSS